MLFDVEADPEEKNDLAGYYYHHIIIYSFIYHFFQQRIPSIKVLLMNSTPK